MRLEAAAVTIRGLLLADVFADLLQLEAHGGHGVPTGPKVLTREIPLLAAQAGHRYGALPFQKPDHRSDRILRRNRDAHVHVVRQQVSLDDLALLLPRQRVEDSPSWRRAWPNSTLRRRFGTITTWYLQSQLE